jgi:hypothetical protein
MSKLTLFDPVTGAVDLQSAERSVLTKALDLGKESRSHWKVLIYDKQSLQVIAPLLKVRCLLYCLTLPSLSSAPSVPLVSPSTCHCTQRGSP